MSTRSAEQLAKRFHELYEELAPSCDYRTRRESAVPWAEVPEKNKSLMVAVCARILGETTQPDSQQTQLIRKLEDRCAQLASDRDLAWDRRETRMTELLSKEAVISSHFGTIRYGLELLSRRHEIDGDVAERAGMALKDIETEWKHHVSVTRQEVEGK